MLLANSKNTRTVANGAAKRSRFPYRVTPNVATFINLFWNTGIVAGNHTSPNVAVEYWVYNHYSKKLTERLRDLLCEEPQGDVVFLNFANLVNKESGAERPIKRQVNFLLNVKDADGKRLFNFHTQQTESEKRASTKNKVRAWTFASSKGCTFPVVVVFGFSVYNGLVPNTNQLCVALSRASRRLIVIHNATGFASTTSCQPYIPPLSSTLLREMTARGVVVCPNGIPHDQKIPEAAPPEVTRLEVTGLTHLSAASIDHLLSMGTRHVLREEAEPLAYVQLHTFHTGTRSSEEDVSAIYGTAIMFAVEHARSGAIKSIEGILASITPDSEARFTTESFAFLVKRTLNISLTNKERQRLDDAMSASPSQTLSGEELVKLFRTSASDFPSLKGHSVRAKKKEMSSSRVPTCRTCASRTKRTTRRRWTTCTLRTPRSPLRELTKCLCK